VKLRISFRDRVFVITASIGVRFVAIIFSLLEDVWMERDGTSGDETWWGSVIDKKQQPYQPHVAPMQFCFG
jgi:hypothetical protein